MLVSFMSMLVQMCIRDRYYPYVRPQESGNHTDIRYFSIFNQMCIRDRVKSDALKYAIAEAESEHGKDEITVNFAFASDGTEPLVAVSYTHLPCLAASIPPSIPRQDMTVAFSLNPPSRISSHPMIFLPYFSSIDVYKRQFQR